MATTKGRRCSACGFVNDESYLRCSQPGCGADLRFAEVVAIDVADGGGDARECSCPTPSVPAGGECFACGGTVPQRTALGEEKWDSEKATEGNQESQSSDDGDFSKVGVKVRLPNDVLSPIETGLLIGRHPEFAEYAIQAAFEGHRGVSWAHAWIYQDQDRVMVVDLASMNGTWVGNDHLQPFRPYVIAIDTLPVVVRFGKGAEVTLTKGSVE